jgi:hypothetical protein
MGWQLEVLLAHVLDNIWINIGTHMLDLEMPHSIIGVRHSVTRVSVLALHD